MLDYVVVESYKELSELVASRMELQLEKKPDSTWLLPTGKTFLGAYEIISHAGPSVYDFSEATIFNLDERLGEPPSSPHSFQWYMRKKLIDCINVKPDNVHLMDGSIMSPERNEAYCKSFDQMLYEKGVDYGWLGLGGEGHVGYNESGSAFDSTTRVVDLAPRTIQDMLLEFENKIDIVPVKGRTVGIRNIFACLDLTGVANGKEKADAAYRSIKCKPDASCPASWMQLHEHALFILDEDAASKL